VTPAIEIREAMPGDLAAIARIQADSREASAWEPSSYLDYDCHVAVGGDCVMAFLVSRELAPPGGSQSGEHEILNLAVGTMLGPAHSLALRCSPQNLSISALPHRKE
jgi:hypothetical protein